MTKSQMEGPTPLKEVKSTHSSFGGAAYRDSRQSFDREELRFLNEPNGNGTQTHNQGTNGLTTENQDNSTTFDQPAINK